MARHWAALLFLCVLDIVCILMRQGCVNGESSETGKAKKLAWVCQGFTDSKSSTALQGSAFARLIRDSRSHPPFRSRTLFSMKSKRFGSNGIDNVRVPFLLNDTFVFSSCVLNRDITINNIL